VDDITKLQDQLVQAQAQIREQHLALKAAQEVAPAPPAAPHSRDLRICRMDMRRLRPAASRTRALAGQEEDVEVLEDVVPEHISDLVEYDDMASPTPRDYRHARRHAAMPHAL
jgi:hypothetical protein